MEIKETTDITSPIFDDAFQIRMAVFVQEQHVPEDLERDHHERGAHHFVGYVDGKPVATVRVREHLEEWRIQRVATLKANRKHGYAGQIIEAIVAQARQQDSIKKVVLDGQITAIEFYEHLGFQAVGSIFTEAGILHRHMQLTIR